MKILVVDDERRLADGIAEGLTKKGYAVETVYDGEEAVSLIAEHPDEYELIVLDLLLPGMSGYDVCRQLRSEERTMPILILTAKCEIEDKTALFAAGADDFLEKPFSFEELSARVQALLRRPQKTIPTVLRAHDIELNRLERTASRDGVPLDLTLKEFSLLEYFLHHPDQVINREDLIAHIWDFEYESFSNVVDVHVKNLREKLDRTSNDSILETIRGIGYRLRTRAAVLTPV